MTWKPKAALAARAAVWFLLMLGETTNGVLRIMLITPVLGDLRARQFGVLIGSLIILGLAYLTCRWLAQLAVGGLWVLLTLVFELTLGRALGYSAERIASDYRITEGGLLPLGLAVMALAPLIAARLRNRRSAAVRGNPP